MREKYAKNRVPRHTRKQKCTKSMPKIECPGILESENA